MGVWMGEKQQMGTPPSAFPKNVIERLFSNINYLSISISLDSFPIFFSSTIVNIIVFSFR